MCASARNVVDEKGIVKPRVTCALKIFFLMCASARIDIDGNGISMAEINEGSVERTDVF